MSVLLTKCVTDLSSLDMMMYVVLNECVTDRECVTDLSSLDMMMYVVLNECVTD